MMADSHQDFPPTTKVNLQTSGTKRKQKKAESVIPDVKSEEDTESSSKTCSSSSVTRHHKVSEALPSTKPKLVRIDSKPVPLEELQVSPFDLQAPKPSFISREKYEWKLYFFPRPVKPAMKLRHRHYSQPIIQQESQLSSKDNPNMILHKLPTSGSHKLPPIGKLSLLPSRPVQKSATWPEVTSAWLPPLLLPQPPKSPGVTLPKPPLPLEKLKQIRKQKYIPTLPIFKLDDTTGEKAVEQMNISTCAAFEEVRSHTSICTFIFIYLYFTII